MRRLFSQFVGIFDGILELNSHEIPKNKTFAYVIDNRMGMNRLFARHGAQAVH